MTTPLSQEARKLPAPAPGREITIPLDLLPIYLEAHRLEVLDPGEVRALELRTKEPRPDGVLLVRRMK